MATDKQVDYILGLQKKAHVSYYIRPQIEKMTHEEVSKAIDYLKEKQKVAYEDEYQAQIREMNKWQMNMWKN